VNRIFLGFLALLLVISGGMVIWTGWRAFYGPPAVVISQDSEPIELQPQMEEFTLTERSGRSVSSEELDGYVYVASFFFASCPSSCRAQNEKMQQLQRAFEGHEVKFLSITCDPEHDTPTVLRQYADIFNADPDNWLFLTGDLEYTMQVGHQFFRVPLNKQAHTEKFVIVDRWGNIRGYYHWAKPDEFTAMQDLIEQLLEEEEPPQDLVAPEVTPEISDHSETAAT
jgi:protein SCO1